ncbi:MAG: hypothetical protein HYV09_25230 [Deltaproteobacteria bacterium]|nr:hypothetical protein [Deltaproteobacteria bacterium]
MQSQPCGQRATARRVGFRIANVAVVIALAATGACAQGSDDAPNVVPELDAQPEVPTIEIGADDATPDGDASVDDTAPGGDATGDTTTDTAVIDSGSADTTAADTTAADTAKADTYVADTYVADTYVADTYVADTTAVDTGADTGAPWRHTITIDGTNDFTAASEKFTTTTSSFEAYVTWDASALYVGYVGSDVASSSATKWLFVYLDANPGTGVGATSSEQYAGQKVTFPSGFGADAYYAWRTDGLYPQAKKYASGVWSDVTAPGVTVNRSGSYVELRIPFAMLGVTVANVGVVSYFINEASSGQWTFAGLYSGSFTDGESLATAPKAVGSYLRVDLSSPAAPNATANKAP